MAMSNFGGKKAAPFTSKQGKKVRKPTSAKTAVGTLKKKKGR